MPYIKVLIHYIWATKNREYLISKELKPLLLQHIKENCIKKEIFLNIINCMPDHIHLLVSLGTEQTIAKTAMLIKGESSCWVNKRQGIQNKFQWQDEYIALSVSYSAKEKVRNYIINQEEHHKKRTFNEEYTEFMKAHQFESNLAKADTDIIKQSTT